MTRMDAARSQSDQFIWLSDLRNQAAGGKAHGLKQLMDWQLPCPDGFVILAVNESVPRETLLQFYEQLGAGKVAVRSSALGEDGEHASFAGLYETILDVQGIDHLRSAIEQCAASLRSDRADAYQHDQHIEPATMCVVVQKMVDAAIAGVLFTVDPVSNRYDRLVIDAVEGLGEALVSGEATPDHYEYDASGELVYQELLAETALLSPEQQLLLVSQARTAEQLAGQPLDMEWAIDRQGHLHWVQARPITTLASDLREHDTSLTADDIVTRCNIGEMMPGACCPLTLSVTGRGIEHGMQHMHVAYAGRPAITDDWTQVAISHGQMFINLSGGAVASANVLGVDVESMGQSICGRIVPGLEAPEPRNLFIRALGFARLVGYVLSADRAIAALSADLEQFDIDTTGDSSAIMQAIDSAIPVLNRVYCVHLQSSSTSGFTGGILQSMLARGPGDKALHEAEAARLLAGAKGVESAILVEQLDDIARSIASLPAEQATSFCNAKPEAALAWITENAPQDIQKTYQGFLERHGHRGYRELCVRQPSWSQAPTDLVKTLQTSVKAQLGDNKLDTNAEAVDPATLSAGLRWILPKAHNAIRRREATKSMLVLTTHKLSLAYHRLGQQLVNEGVLNDSDQVFFFSHAELKTLADEAKRQTVNHNTWADIAGRRALALSFQNQLQFDEVCYGYPQPIDNRQQSEEQEGLISGRPVSRGVVEGIARVARSVDEASALQPGEILVAPITDVGWTPYFNLIAGLITDIGSSVSHGAVIAREYGLPAIVNTGAGTRRISTGDLIRLDADQGVVELLNIADVSTAV
ncbi:pyruvate, water dikinase [Halioglobus maricola]|uniref:Pyruvate, water dikinase n=1 Tax=Halioglobus maricola TaxID=2601894 RepID=A0A5P9NKQ4_9GAMM|nr:PEP/pyruvate-binding domain-containing protein [Halioglobus maricola]QFU76095.1 pyruvate, water dikinase [Halioglobus maricola]